MYNTTITLYIRNLTNLKAILLSTGKQDFLGTVDLRDLA